MVTIKCEDYTTALKVDNKYEMLRDGGLKAVTETMGAWGWWFLIMPWLLAHKMDLYIKQMRDVLVCGIQNSVPGSRYATIDFLGNTFEPYVGDAYASVLDNLLLYWHPGITHAAMFIPGV